MFSYLHNLYYWEKFKPFWALLVHLTQIFLEKKRSNDYTNKRSNYSLNKLNFSVIFNTFCCQLDFLPKKGLSLFFTNNSLTPCEVFGNLIWVNMCYFGVFLTNFSSFFLKKKLQIFITNTMQILWTKRNNTFFLPQFKMFCWNLSQNVPFCLVSKNPFILMTSYGMEEGGLRKVRQNVKFRLSFINFTRKWL